MSECSCTCKMCELYGHRDDLVHCAGCPEWVRAVDVVSRLGIAQDAMTPKEDDDE